MITRHFIRNKTTTIPDNEIWYTSKYGYSSKPNRTNGFGANIISNTYENGKGIIKFDASVTSIGEKAFYWVYDFISIKIPNSVTYIGESAFEGCCDLISITIPNSVTSIGKYAFKNCPLISITIPNSIKRIETQMFSDCHHLTSVTIGKSVTSIKDWVFSNCSSLKTITCEAITPPVLSSLNDLSTVTAVYVPAQSVNLYKAADNWSSYEDKIQAIP